MKLEFWDFGNGKKLSEFYSDATVSALPENSEIVILFVPGQVNAEPERKRYAVKSREFYYEKGMLDKVQIGLIEK